MSDYTKSVWSAVTTPIYVVAEQLVKEASQIVVQSRPRNPRSCWRWKRISRRHLAASKLLEELTSEDIESFRNNLR